PGEAGEEVDAGRIVARDQVALARPVAADRVARRAVDEHADAVAQGARAAEVGADEIALDDGPRGAGAGDLDAALEVARDQVLDDPGAGGRLDRDADGVAQGGRAADVGADEVAEDDVSARPADGDARAVVGR